MKYLILENDSKPNLNTQQYLLKKMNEGETVETNLISPMESHCSVVSEMKFGYTHVVLLEPTIYRASQLNKVAHDLIHSWRVRRFFYGIDDVYY